MFVFSKMNTKTMAKRKVPDSTSPAEETPVTKKQTRKTTTVTAKRKRDASPTQPPAKKPTPPRGAIDLPVIELAIRKDKPELKESTLTGYRKKLSTLLTNKRGGTPVNARKLLTDTKFAKEHMDSLYPNANTRKGGYVALAVSAKALGFTKQYETYSKIVSGLSQQLLKKAMTNQVPKKFTDKGMDSVASWDVLVQRANEMTSKGDGSMDSALAALLILSGAPRRPGEFGYMYFYEQNPFADDAHEALPVRDTQSLFAWDDNNVGWNVLFPVSSTQYKMVIRSHKMNQARNHGTYVTTLSKEVSAVLKAYIKKQGIQDDSPLFPRPLTREPYGEKLSDRVVTFLAALTKGLGWPALSAKDLRDARVTHSRQDTTLNMAEKVELANDMGHSPAVQDIYYNKVTPKKVDVRATRSQSSANKTSLLQEKASLLKRLAEIEQLLKNMTI